MLKDRFYNLFEKIHGFFLSGLELPGKVAYAVLIGVFGNILIPLFFSSFLSLSQVITLIPWIMGFSAAVTGYSLLEKTRDRLRHKRASCILAGIANVAISYVILTYLSFYFVGEYLFNKWDPVVFLAVGALCSFLGGILAIKYLNLKDRKK